MKKSKLKADDCSPLTAAVDRGEVRLVSLGRGQYPGARLSTGRLPGLKTVGYWDAVGVQTWGLPMHRNEGIEICYLISGETLFATDKEEWHLRPGDITITRPWQRHKLGNPNIGPCKLFWMILDVESSDGRAAWEFPDWIGPDIESRRELLKVFRKNPRCQLLSDSQQLRDFMQESCEFLHKDDPLSTSRISNLVNHLLLTVAQRLSETIQDKRSDPQGFDQTIREFFRGLESSIDKAAEPWSVSDIAHTCRVGITYLTSSCREMFNTTPSEQLNRIRLFHSAKRLCADKDATVTDIAHLVGFSSSQYFATRFRKQFGKTPKEYRETTPS